MTSKASDLSKPPPEVRDLSRRHGALQPFREGFREHDPAASDCCGISGTRF